MKNIRFEMRDNRLFEKYMENVLNLNAFTVICRFFFFEFF